MAKTEKKEAEDGKAAATVTDETADTQKASEQSGGDYWDKRVSALEGRVAHLEEQASAGDPLANRVSQLESMMGQDANDGLKPGLSDKERKRQEEQRRKDDEETKAINDKLGVRGRVKSL